MITVNDLAAVQQGEFAALDFLHLDDHIGGVNIGGRGHNTGPGLTIGLVGKPDTAPGVLFDHYRMACGDQRLHAVGDDPDPVFVVLDFPWNTDAHDQADLMAFTQEPTSAGPA